MSLRIVVELGNGLTYLIDSDIRSTGLTESQIGDWLKSVGKLGYDETGSKYRLLGQVGLGDAGE